MVVAVVGIAKRCHEIANSRQDELQARLESDGSLPKKTDFIEIMLNIWKDSMRILGEFKHPVYIFISFVGFMTSRGIYDIFDT